MRGIGILPFLERSQVDHEWGVIARGLGVLTEQTVRSERRAAQLRSVEDERSVDDRDTPGAKRVVELSGIETGLRIPPGMGEACLRMASFDDIE